MTQTHLDTTVAEALPIVQPEWAKWSIGDLVTKTKGSRWTGTVVGFYSTEYTPRGYAIESLSEIGSVQIYPESALREINLNAIFKDVKDLGIGIHYKGEYVDPTQYFQALSEESAE